MIHTEVSLHIEDTQQFQNVRKPKEKTLSVKIDYVTLAPGCFHKPVDLAK